MRRTWAVLFLGILACSSTVAQEAASPAPTRFEAARAVIEKEFIRELPPGEVEKRALRALLADLDPYSNYLDAEEWKLFESDFASGFAGIGVTLRIDPEADLPQVEYLMLESAARTAGVRRGDHLVAIDGRPLKGLPFETIIPWLRGAAGTTVEVTVRPGGSAELVPLVITRQTVRTPSVRGARRDAEGREDYLLDRERRVAYIRIMRFGDDTLAEVESALDSAKRAEMESLVLDLRDSVGGKMNAALGVADLFLDGGTMLTVVSRDTKEVHEATKGVRTGVPVVLLINGGTASSSEILAGALVDHGRVIAIGQRTFGKGRVQRKFPLGEGLGGLVLTTGTFQRPSGKTIDKHDQAAKNGEAGIAPSSGFEIELSSEEVEAWTEDMAHLDTRLELTAEEQRPKAADRVLDAALKALAATAATAATGGTPAQ